MRWRCRASVLSLARAQNSAHRISRELCPTNGHERANNRTSHMLQKTIRGKHQNEALGMSDDTQTEETAPWIARRAGGGPEC